MPKSSILAIETSVETGSVALQVEGQLLAEHSFFAGRKPSATLWPALEEVMTGIDALDLIVVGIGPGSYNGSRVGIAAAQGIALVHNCPVAPICSFEGVATDTQQALAIGDARRGSFSLQKVTSGRIEEDFSLVDQTDLEATILANQKQGHEVFSFDPATRFPVSEEAQAVIKQKNSQARLLINSFTKRSPAAQQLCLETLPEPFYLRDPHITMGKRKSLLER